MTAMADILWGKAGKDVRSNNEDLLAFMRSKWQVYYTCYKQKR